MTQLALIPQQDLTRRPEPDELRADLTMLFTAFPTQERQNPEQVIATYMLALEEFSAAEIHAGIMKFIKGAWPGHDGKFVPSCAMVARAARAAADEIKAAAQQQQASEALARRRARERAKEDAEARHAKQIELEHARRTPEQRAAWIETLKRGLFQPKPTQELSDD